MGLLPNTKWLLSKYPFPREHYDPTWGRGLGMEGGSIDQGRSRPVPYSKVDLIFNVVETW